MDNDVIGTALLDYYNKRCSSEIVVKSSIAEDDIISIPYLFRVLPKLPKVEKKALELCSGKVLDVGAGSGCHSLILKNNGQDVIAIDTSEGAVEVMQKRGLNVLHIDFYDVNDKFDTLLFMMNGIGIARTLDGLETFLTKAKSLLIPGGQILLDSSDIMYMFKEDDGSIWMDLNKSYYGEVVYQMEYKGLATPKFNWLFVDYQTLEDAAKEVGLYCKKIIDGEHHDYLARLWF